MAAIGEPRKVIEVPAPVDVPAETDPQPVEKPVEKSPEKVPVPA